MPVRAAEPAAWSQSPRTERRSHKGQLVIAAPVKTEFPAGLVKAQLEAESGRREGPWAVTRYLVPATGEDAEAGGSWGAGPPASSGRQGSSLRCGGDGGDRAQAGPFACRSGNRKERGWLPRAGGSRGSSSLSPRQKGKGKATASGEPAGDRSITTDTRQGAPALEGLPRGPGPRETRLTTFPSARFRRPHPVFSHVVPYAVSFYRRIKAGKRQASHRGAE